MPKRIQRKRTKGWKMPENTVCVTRGTAWGNPFKIGPDGTREQCIQKYKDWLLPYHHHGLRCTLQDFYISEANIEAIVADLAGKNLACWCPLDQPCHADVLLELANS